MLSPALSDSRSLCQYAGRTEKPTRKIFRNEPRTGALFLDVPVPGRALPSSAWLTRI